MTGNRSYRHKKNKYYKKAKKEGYRARSAYKLIDIQKNFNIFENARNIVDIGSAPGSWLQVAKNFVGEHSDDYRILGVDIDHVSPIEEVNILQMDATTSEFKEKLASYFQDPIDVIVSDASIDKSGNKFNDHIRQIQLCYKILELAQDFLKKNGNLVLKAFQGPDFNKLYDKLKRQFDMAKAYKPKASKKSSNEMYFVCLGIKEYF
jgi:23S rRNA (uridine2552-2'-O)-methyltransferase